MDRLIKSAIKCAGKIMKRRGENIAIVLYKNYCVLYIRHKDRIGSVTFREGYFNLSDILRHIHFYATGYYPKPK